MNAKLTGYGVLVWLGLFFGLILVTNSIFVTLAVKTFRGEDEARPYLQGVAYNQTLARRAQQAALGWRATIAARRVSSASVAVELDVRGAAGAPQAGLMLAGELRHPADEHRDRQFLFREVAPGRYRSELAGVTPGDWDVLARTQKGAPFEASRRLWVP
jgi:nitrogen fixation protein FixH